MSEICTIITTSTEETNMLFTKQLTELNALIDALMDLDTRTEVEETRYRNAVQIRATLLL